MRGPMNLCVWAKLQTRSRWRCHPILVCELFMFCTAYPPKVTVYFPREDWNGHVLDPVQSERPQENYKIEWKKQTAPS